MRGYSSLVMRNAGYDLSSFKLILYFGLCCFMSVFSKTNASHTDTTIHSIEVEEMSMRVLCLFAGK